MSSRTLRTPPVPAFVALAIVLLAVFGVWGSRTGRAGDVVLIVIDTLRADHVSSYGYARRTSPALDAFARDSVTYANAISPGTWTVPAHGSLFTGRWPSFHGAERVPGARNLATPLNPEVPTLAELLSAAGFRTAAFVANSAYVSRVLGFDRGFAEFFDHNLNVATDVENAVRAWLPRDQRLFLFLNVLDPHEPYEPPPPFDQRFPGKRPELGTMMTVLVYGGTPVTSDLQAHFVSQYDGEIAFADESLGRILRELKRAGRYDGALIVVTSDHGELLGEHGLAGHGFAPYEQLLHVPLVVKLPQQHRRGERVDRRVSTMSVFPAILAAAGVAPPSGAQARPLDDAAQPVWMEDVSYGGDRVRVGYDGSRKLVVRVSPASTRTAAVYDLARDPTESEPDSDAAAGEPLRAALAAFAAAPRPTNPRHASVIDPEREAKLRALGYVE